MQETNVVPANGRCVGRHVLICVIFIHIDLFYICIYYNNRYTAYVIATGVDGS